MNRSPGWAGALSVLFPGLGHLYVRATHRAIALAASWIALISSISHYEGLIPMMVALWVFGIVDAVQSAEEAIRAAAEARDPDFGLDRRWAWGLVIVGTLAALSATPVLRWLARLWPAILIVVGIRILRDRPPATPTRNLAKE